MWGLRDASHLISHSLAVRRMLDEAALDTCGSKYQQIFTCEEGMDEPSLRRVPSQFLQYFHNRWEVARRRAVLLHVCE